VKIPPRGRIYSLNEANTLKWPKGLQQYVSNIKTGKGELGQSYTARYIGSMVGDIHRCVYKCMCISIYVYTCIHMYMDIFINLKICTPMYTYINIHSHKYMYVGLCYMGVYLDIQPTPRDLEGS
jgi:hypothetical protein